jgi:DNA repair protein RadC
MGGITQTTVDLRIIFKAALEHNAVALAVAHNHPSGRLSPSNADKELTRRITEAGNLLHIKLIEHIIVGILPDGKHDYFSFSENGLL